MNDVTKTLLYGYPGLKRTIESTNLIIEHKALISHRYCNKLYQQVNDIISLIEYSTQIYSATSIVDEVLELLTDSEKRIIAYKYFNKKDISGFDFAARTYYRKIEKIEAKIDAMLAHYKMDEKWFMKKFGDIVYLRKLYFRIKNKVKNTKKAINSSSFLGITKK